MRILLSLALLLCFQGITAQEQLPEISISFQNADLREVLLKIEDNSGYTFFYLEEWLPREPVSGEYNKVPLNVILQDLLENSLLNFYVQSDTEIILTKGNTIYDELPVGFFREREMEVPQNVTPTAETYNPIFFQENENEEESETETVYIGRNDRTRTKNRFTLQGYARTKETGDPISNLSVSVKGTNSGTVTDENGFYSLELPGGVSILETQSLGSEDVEKRVVIYNDGKLNFELKENYEQLGEILLDSNADKNVNSSIAGAETINVEEIKNIPLVLGERDIMKVAATLPGISTAGEGAAGFNVRGGKTDQNLILLDDAVMYNPAHFFGIFSAINPFTTGDVNIYKGSVPAEYGGRLSSVFDIKTKDANTQKFAGEVSLGPVTSNVSLEIPLVKEQSGLLLGARGTYSDWILKSLEEESLQNSRASFYDVIAKYNHKFNDQTDLKATGYFSRDVFSITSDSLFNYNNRLFSLRLNHKLNDKNRGSLILSNSDYQFGIDYNSEFNNNFATGYSINETEAKLNMKYVHSPAHQFDYGISGKLYRVKPGYIEPQGAGSIVEPLTLENERGLESAVYISDNYKVNERLLVNAGLRYSLFSALGRQTQLQYFEGVPKTESAVIDTLHFGKNEIVETYGGPEVRVSARYFLLPDLSVKVSYNNTFQYIHTLSNNTTVSPTDTYTLSDQHIEPQRSRQYSLGIYKNFSNNMYEFSLEGYYKNATNILDYKVGAELFLNENIETQVLQGEGEAYGAEFLLKKTRGKLNGWLGYTYSRSFVKLDGSFPTERVNSGEYFPANYDKPHDLSLVTNYKITQRFSFSANFVYQTGRPVTFPVGKYIENGGQYVVYSDRNQFRIPDYYRLDLSFNVEGNHKIKKLAHSFWNISVYNVLGRNNPYSVFFVTEDGNVQAYQSSIFSIPVPTITYNFKF